MQGYYVASNAMYYYEFADGITKSLRPTYNAVTRCADEGEILGSALNSLTNVCDSFDQMFNTKIHTGYNDCAINLTEIKDKITLIENKIQENKKTILAKTGSFQTVIEPKFAEISAFKKYILALNYDSLKEKKLRQEKSASPIVANTTQVAFSTIQKPIEKPIASQEKSASPTVTNTKIASSNTIEKPIVNQIASPHLTTSTKSCLGLALCVTVVAIAILLANY